MWPKLFTMSVSDVISLLFTLRWWIAVGDFFPDILETRFHTFFSEVLEFILETKVCHDCRRDDLMVLLLLARMIL